MSKNIFRVAVLLLLSAILTVVLIRNKKAVQFEVDTAKTMIDSIPVSIISLQPDSASFRLEIVGRVRSADEVYVVSQTPGEIKQVFVKIGEAVAKGDVILQIDDFYAQQEYEMAKKAYDQIQKDFDRYSNLAEVSAVTKQQLEQLRLQLEGALTKLSSLEKRLNDYVIKAPVSGVINQFFVTKGNVTGPGTPVCEIVGGSSIKIEAKINPEQAGFLQVGLRARMSGDFGHGENYHVRLAEIGEKAGKFGGTAAVFTLAPEEKKSPKSGSVVNIVIDIPVGTKLLLPRQALTNQDGKSGIFIVRSDNSVEFTQVRYSDFDDNRIALIGNELNNIRVAVEGNFLLKDGDLVKVIN
jgi:RND family efflux transporter MFP subunit